jgi:hypothetical protein
MSVGPARPMAGSEGEMRMSYGNSVDRRRDVATASNSLSCGPGRFGPDRSRRNNRQVAKGGHMKIQQQSSKETKNRGGDVSSPDPILNTACYGDETSPPLRRFSHCRSRSLCSCPARVSPHSSRTFHSSLRTSRPTRSPATLRFDPTRAGILIAPRKTVAQDPQITPAEVSSQVCL